MKTIYFIFLFVMLIVFVDADYYRYYSDEHNAQILFPEHFIKMISNNGVMFMDSSETISFSLLFSDSEKSLLEHLISIEKSFNVVNLLDSADIFMNDEELSEFNVEIGMKSFFYASENDINYGYSVMIMEKNKKMYIVFAQISPFVSTRNYEIVNYCLSQFRIVEDE